MTSEELRASIRASIAPVCVVCKKIPSEIPEYVEYAKADDISPEDFVRTWEGTFNPQNGHFACTDCYVFLGMPTSPKGWKAP